MKLKQVKTSKYLGVQTRNKENQKAEINDRINAAMNLYYALNKNVLMVRGITEKAKEMCIKQFSAKSPQLSAT